MRGPDVTADEPCPCGSGTGYDDCCGPLHRGSARAATAEQLMRSRFSAFAVGDDRYLHDTWDAGTRPDEVELDRRVRWTRLRVLDVVAGGENDTHGEVEFRAHFRVLDEPGTQTERSRFRRDTTGQWTYVDAAEP